MYRDHQPVQGVRLQPGRWRSGPRPAAGEALGLRSSSSGRFRSGLPQADHFAGSVLYPDDRPDGGAVRAHLGGRPRGRGLRLDRLARRVDRIGRARFAAAPAACTGPTLAVACWTETTVPRTSGSSRRSRLPTPPTPAPTTCSTTGRSSVRQLADADVAITDISAMVYDRLATGKPIIVARPQSPEAEVDEAGFLGSAQRLRADEAEARSERWTGH